MVMTGPALLRWARARYGQWFELRHGVRELPEELLAEAYLKGAIDALGDETARLIQKGKERCPTCL
jgi:hypothetical protein